MKNTVSIIALILYFTAIHSQQKEVDIIVAEIEVGLVFKAVNIGSIQQEVTLSIDSENLTGYKNPITKLVPANDTIPMATLSFIPGKPWNYKTNYTYNQKPKDEERTALKKGLLNGLGHSNSKITVFVKPGCSRSAYITTYLKTNKIPFKSYNTANDAYNKIMWQLLRCEEPNIKNVTFPVILVEDKTSYNIAALQLFAENMKKSR